ncbi:MAG: DNA repair protein RadC [Kiritimatiellia bacterium]
MPSPDPKRIEDLPAEQRPRERFDAMGADKVDVPTLLAILLRTGIPGVNVYELARNLFQQFGGITALCRADRAELARSVRGLGPDKVRTLHAALELARRLARESRADILRIQGPEDAALLLREDALLLSQEHLWVLCLDVRNQLLGSPHPVTIGTVNGTLVHPREVFRKPVALSATSVILVHNHPSGDITPSMEDLRSTREVVAAGRTLGIRVHDHLILGRPATEGAPWFSSLRQMGLVTFEE